MSNYTIAVAWSGKDALSDSDAAKVISGGDFNTEFTAVQTAVNTKAEVNGAAAESFSATTATAGTNTTQVATTAFVTDAVSKANMADIVYPVGAIFTTVTAYADSAAVVAAIGGTTWVAFGGGKVLVGVDSGDTDFDTIEETGGSKTHALTTAEMPTHNHGFTGARTYNISLHDIAGTVLNGNPSYGSSASPTTDNTGSGDAHTVVQPYITVYMWKRTA
jgi:hypothetical protein